MRMSVFAFIFMITFVAVVPADISVLEFGARGDGVLDNTGAFQSALDEAGKTGDIVRVPAGQYRFEGVLSIPEDTAMEGVCKGYHFPNGTKGTVLMVYAGRNDETSEPFITLNTNATVQNVTIIYPEQKAKDIRPYPWTLQVKGKGNIIGVSMANSYNGIDCGTFSNGGTCVSDIYLCALRRGIYIDRASDIGRYENIQIMLWGWTRIGDPWTPDRDDRETFRLFVQANLEGFIIGRTDWAYMTNCFVLRPNIGFHFIETELRPEEDHTFTIYQSNMLITQSGSDLGKVAVLIDKVQEHAGISFENCQFMNGIMIGEQNTGPVKLTGCGFWGETNSGPLNGSVILNKGTGVVMLTGCHFSRWEDLRRNVVEWNPKIPLIDMHAGSLIMNGCLFKDYTDPPDFHVHLGSAVSEAAVTGTIVEGSTIRVNNETQGRVKISGNP